ncbi:BolA family protein [Methylogaea oryzae]|uniref:BolA family transcriptional regulator n=1 Tax=Methylogaea oryzae TaxID=1295382 RepID=A0A8D4VRW7_9GAMM|nr:BolA family protein [Methylogaea oryzae]BBL71245.1 BolA family transcriptional regulator [Methylogaea oryzae]
MTPRAEAVHARLTEALSPAHLEIVDDSMAHAGHAGAMQSGGGHFYALIVSESFAGKSSVQRHQMVYRALGDMLRNDIHAFSMKVYTPLEYQSQKEATR